MKAEFLKLIKLKVSYLLIVPILIPLIITIGALVQNLLKTESQGVLNIINSDTSAATFIFHMLNSAHIFFVFIIAILGSSVLSKEIENGQIGLYVVRLANRSKIILYKFFSLALLQIIYFIAFTLVSLLLYAIFVLAGNIEWAWGKIDIFFISFISLYLNIVMLTSLNLFIGGKLKPFLTFSITFIFYIITMYMEYVENIKMFFPQHFANLIFNNFSTNHILYISLFITYSSALLALCIKSFRKKDL
jgi:ABC-type transport system involved in multi-copper enzyme maturation permease subunit